MSDWRVALTEIAIPEQDVRAVLDCLESGWLTMGPCTWRAWRRESAPATR
jgi:hypothetical protein